MITLDFSLEEARAFLNTEDGIYANELFNRVIDLNGLKVIPIRLEEYSDSPGYDSWFDKYQYKSLTRVKIELQLVQPVKSKEQLAAEEAVKKAEQSLEAAKQTLQQIKEK